MSSPLPEYWASVAQVVPLFALGIVVEWRTILIHRSDDLPWYVRAFQSLMWGACLLVLGLSEIVALNALRGDSISDSWPTFIAFAITSSVSVLILAPMVELGIRTNPELPAIILSRHPIVRFKRNRSHRKILRLIRASERMLERGRVAHEQNSAMIAAAGLRLERLRERLEVVRDAEMSDEMLRERAELESELSDLTKSQEEQEARNAASAEELDQLEREVLEGKTRYLAEHDEMTRNLREVLAEERRLWESALKEIRSENREVAARGFVAGTPDGDDAPDSQA